MGEREILPLMKWERILDLTKVSRFTLIPSPATSSITPLDAISTSILLLGTQVYEKRFSFPHNLLSCCIVASSSFNNTSKMFVIPEWDFSSLAFF
jgi:hypothetical protein